MAVAVKNTPEVAPSGLLTRLPIVSILGAIYALGCLGIVFSLLPALWRLLSFGGDSFVSMTLLGLVMLASAAGLIAGGGRLLAPRTVPGVRAGIFVCLVGFVMILLLTRWASLWVEYLVYDRGLFGASGPTAGAILVAVIAAALLFGAFRLLTRPRTESLLLRLDGQGWFSTRSFKPLQGLRVRRGTIFGILILAGCGIYTLLSHGTLQRGPRDWQLNIPFTEHITVTSPGDAHALLKEKNPSWNEDETDLVVDRATLRDINAEVDPATHVKIVVPDPSLPGAAEDWKEGQIIPKGDYDAVMKKVKSGETILKAVPPQPATGPTSAATVTLLPALPFTVPLLLLGLSLWLAWRIVNLPMFADFLIATDAEMNKVSWITQKRLVQDTIVVLVTVVLMTIYLFAMDQTWRVVLSWKPIGVLILPSEDQQGQSANMDERPW
jgi:preprotein translocase SecE subunit